MPDHRRRWTEDEIAKLKTMAGQIPRKEIAAQLGRTVGATAVEACKLELSLRKQPATSQQAFAETQRVAATAE